MAQAGVRQYLQVADEDEHSINCGHKHKTLLTAMACYLKRGKQDYEAVFRIIRQRGKWKREEIKITGVSERQQWLTIKT